MCAPALPLIAAGMAALGTGVGALQANAQANYKAKIAERNAGLEREAWLQDQQNTRGEAQAQYRQMAKLQGQQRVAAGANGVAIDFGTAADVVADTKALGSEDVGRIYSSGFQKMRGRDIAASNYVGEANAARSAGTAALVKGVFDMGSTILGGAQQYNKYKKGN
ncbi:hypothetical protein NVSP9465_01646 [Novosphingobium sp. CECT 9465]|nr:hypothetical protein NVSP9465_01646 [Novosphingobium sp. CECT 9465]